MARNDVLQVQKTLRHAIGLSSDSMKPARAPVFQDHGSCCSGMMYARSEGPQNNGSVSIDTQSHVLYGMLVDLQINLRVGTALL